MAGGDDRGVRQGRFAPFGLLSPGVIWLILFFMVPVFLLVQVSLSTKPSRFANPKFDWNFSNYADALSDFQPQFIRSFVFAGIATILAILIGYPLAPGHRAGRDGGLAIGAAATGLARRNRMED